MSFHDFPFFVSKDSLWGVCVTYKYRDLFNSNFKMVFNKAKQDMERWSTLPLSLAGRINSVKMAIMPRFLSFFQAIPVFIPKSFFKDLNKLISTFIWNKKVPWTPGTEFCKNTLLFNNSPEYMDRWMFKYGPSRQRSDNIQRVALLPLDRLARLWEEKLRTTISEANWQAAITLVHSSSLCIPHGLLQFKVLHRLHLSASKLAKLYPGLDPTCIRWRRDPASLSHMFWLCPKLTLFWTGIYDTFTYSICVIKLLVPTH